MTSFHSLNGGIDCLIPHFSDCLVASGIDEFYRVASDDASNQSIDKNLRDDLILFKSGIGHIDNKEKELRILIQLLREEFNPLKNLYQEHLSITEFIKNNKKKWEVLADQAKKHIFVLRQQAINAEIKLAKELGFYSEMMNFQASFNFLGIESLLQSHQQLQEDLLFLKQIFKTDITQGSMTKIFNELTLHQKKLLQLEDENTEISKKLKLAKKAYFDKKVELNNILRKLSTDEQQALFRIYYYKKESYKIG